MLIESGKFEGKESEVIFLNDPDYVLWYIANYPNAKLGKEFNRLLELYNRKPFAKTCYDCERAATRATAYKNTPDLYFWCDDCDPYGSGAVGGTLTVVKTYQGAYAHISGSLGNTKSFRKEIVKQLAVGKGLPNRVNAKARAAFFG